MRLDASVDQPGWYELKWEVKVGIGSSMDWITLVGSTVNPVTS